MINKKVVSALMAAIAVSCLAGCTGRTESGEVSESEKKDVVKLDLLQFKVDQAPQIQAMVADFNEQHPDIVINATVEGDGYSALRKSRFAGGEGPDIFFVEGYSDAREWGEHLEDLSNEKWMEDVVETSKDGVTIDGKIYGFPIGLEGYGFVYNKDLFEEAGITEEPKTLSELRAVNEKLKSAGIQGNSDCLKEWWFLGQHLLSVPFSLVENPEEFSEKISAEEGKIADNSFMDGFFDVVDMMVEYGNGANSIGTDYDTMISKFAAGETAMLMTGCWAEPSILGANPDLNLGMFAIPMSDNEEDARMAVNASAYYVINKDSEHIEEAKIFLKWLHENGQHYLVDTMNMVPAFKSMSVGEDAGRTLQIIDTYVGENKTCPFGFFLWPVGAKQEFYVPLQQYAAGQSSREETLAGLQDIWDKFADN